MPDITEQSVNEKLAKNETLTKEEMQFVMSMPPENASMSNVPPSTEEGEEDIQWPEFAEGEEPKAKEKETEPAKEQEKATPPPVTPPPEDAKIDMERLETELQKPEGQEDLKDLSKREVAYFWQMRRDRRARQKAEEDRDAAIFREIQRKNADEAKTKVPEEDPLKELNEKDDEDFLTVKDIKKLLAKQKEKPQQPKQDMPAGPDPIQAKYLAYCESEARTKYEDYDAVMELVDELVRPNPKYGEDIINAIKKGENPAETIYRLIKENPEFEKLFPAAQVRAIAKKNAQAKPKTPDELAKERSAAEAQDAILKNQNKPKTTGHATGEGSGAEDTGAIDGYSVNDILRMSDLEFARLPKKTRQKFLQTYG